MNCRAFHHFPAGRGPCLTAAASGHPIGASAQPGGGPGAADYRCDAEAFPRRASSLPGYGPAWEEKLVASCTARCRNRNTGAQTSVASPGTTSNSRTPCTASVHAGPGEAGVPHRVGRQHCHTCRRLPSPAEGKTENKIPRGRKTSQIKLL